MKKTLLDLYREGLLVSTHAQAEELFKRIRDQIVYSPEETYRTEITFYDVAAIEQEIPPVAIGQQIPVSASGQSVPSSLPSGHTPRASGQSARGAHAMATTNVCRTCGQEKPDADFVPYRNGPGHFPDCRDCQNARRSGRTPTQRKQPEMSATIVTDSGYVASRELLQVWDAVRAGAARTGKPRNLMFLGPSGCGKTVAAEYLAELAAVAFTKVDASAMTDPEAWFGTREVVSQDGVAVTTYRPSEFVRAISKPGVLLIDEINRIRDADRNILLPLTDGTYQVTNPLTGEVVKRHPECMVIMSGNRGLHFTGTYAVDPALMTRSYVLEFNYLNAGDETRVAQGRTGCTPEIAALFVRFASETRTRAKADEDMTPMSTREVLGACELVADGLNPDIAAQIVVLNGASDEGGASSVRNRLQQIWTGIRTLGKAPADELYVEPEDEG